MPTPMKVSSTTIFSTTMALLMLADSETPRTSRLQTAATPSAATRLKVPVRGKLAPAAPCTNCTSGVAQVGPSPPANWIVGNRLWLMPKSDRIETTYPDQPTATVAAATPYSSTSSQPMTQAKTSPMVP